MTIANFLLALIAIFVAAKLFGALAERLGQPAVLGELVGGAVAGVSGLRLVNPGDATIHLLAQLGVILLLFLIGLNTDLAKLLRVGLSAAVVAITGVVLTFGGGFALGRALGLDPLIAVFLGASLTATSVGITARVLSDLGQLHCPESQVILGAAVVDDIIGVILLTLIGRIGNGANISAAPVTRLIILAFGFVIVAIAIGDRLAPLLIKLIDYADVTRGLFFASLIFALGLAYIAERVGSVIIIGSFAAGLVLARTEKGEQIEREIHDLAHFFVPIFFVAVGAAIDVKTLNPFDPVARKFLAIGIGLTIVAIAGKMLAGFATPRRGVRRAVVGAGMIPRGEVSLIFAQMGLATGLLTAGLYASVTVVVVLTAVATPLLLRALLPQEVPNEVHGRADYVMDAPMEDERRSAARNEKSPGGQPTRLS